MNISSQNVAAPQNVATRSLYVGVMGLLGVALLSLFTLDRIKYPIARFLDDESQNGSLLTFVIKLLNVYDYGLMVFVFAVAVILFIWEVRFAELSRALSDAPPVHFAIFLVSVFSWFAHSYLHPGLLLGGDTTFHIARVAHFSLGLQEGRLVYWDNYWMFGVPLLQFASVLFIWITGALDFLISDPNLATKLVLFVLHFLSAGFTYLFLRETEFSRFASAVGALAYGGAWAHLHMMLYKGPLPQALTFALMPLAFLFVERVLKQSTHVNLAWVGLALTGAALLVNHPTNGAFAGLYMVYFIAASLIVRRYPWSRLASVMTAGALGVVMFAFILVPFVAETDWIMAPAASGLITFEWPGTIYLERLLVWRNTNTGPGSNFDGYIGISVAVLVLVGVFAVLRDLLPPRIRVLSGIAIVGALLSSFLEGPHTRDIIFTLFFLAMLAAAGSQYLLSRFRSTSRIPALIVTVILLDLGSTAIQPLARTDKTYIADAARYLIAQETSSRILPMYSYDGDLSASIWGSGPNLYYPVQQTGTCCGGNVTLVHNYAASIVKAAESELSNDGQLTPETVRQLVLLNVARIVNDTGSAMDMPAEVTQAESEGPLGRVVRIRNASPVVFASRLVQMAPAATLDKPVFWDDSFDDPDHRDNARVAEIHGFIREVVDTMSVDPESAFATALPVRSLPEASAIPSNSPSRWEARLLDYEVGIDRIDLKLQSERAGYVRLAHAWYPSLSVMHNGSRVQPLQSAMSFLVLPMDAGINEYSIVPVRTTVRRVTGWISAAALAFVLVLGVVCGLRRRAQAAV